MTTAPRSDRLALLYLPMDLDAFVTIVGAISNAVPGARIGEPDDEGQVLVLRPGVIAPYSGLSAGGSMMTASHDHDFDVCGECEAMFSRGYESAIAANPNRAKRASWNELFVAAKHVVAWDWSDNDADCVADVERLRAAVKAYDAKTESTEGHS